MFSVLKRSLVRAYWFVIKSVPWLRPIYETRYTQTPITITMWFIQKVCGFNRRVYWPVHLSSIVTGHKNILAGVETCPGYMPGCYIQGMGKIYIGDYTQISANVVMVSANHDLHDNRKHMLGESIRIGKYCWIGANVTILPGVELGDYTIVGAGAVVTKSFKDGYCVIGGNPARQIRNLEREKCVFHKSEHEYCGYVPKGKFEDFRRKNLNV